MQSFYKVFKLKLWSNTLLNMIDSWERLSSFVSCLVNSCRLISSNFITKLQWEFFLNFQKLCLIYHYTYVMKMDKFLGVVTISYYTLKILEYIGDWKYCINNVVAFKEKYL